MTAAPSRRPGERVVPAIRSGIASRKLLFIASCPLGPMAARARHLAASLCACGEFTAEIVYHASSDRPNVLARVIGLARLLWRLVFESRANFVYILDVGPYHLAALLAIRAMRSRCRVVLDEGDLLASVRKSSEGNPNAGRMLALCQRWGDYWADAVVVRSQYHRERLLAGGRSSRVFHLPDGVDTAVFRPRDVGHVRAEMGLTNQFVVGVSGSLRSCYLYGHDVVEVVARLRHVPVMGLVIGGGEGMSSVRRHAESLGVAERIVLTGPVDNERRRAELLCAMDVALLTRFDEEWSRVVTTGKLPEYLACQRYVVASDVGEFGRIVCAQELGSAIPIDRDLSSYYDRVAALVRSLILDGSDLVECGVRGRRVACRGFSYESLGRRLVDILRGVEAAK